MKRSRRREQISYSQLRQEINTNNVQEVTVKFDGFTYLVHGKLHRPSGNSDKLLFVTRAFVTVQVVGLL